MDEIDRDRHGLGCYVAALDPSWIGIYLDSRNRLLT